MTTPTKEKRTWAFAASGNTKAEAIAALKARLLLVQQAPQDDTIATIAGLMLDQFANDGPTSISANGYDVGGEGRFHVAVNRIPTALD